MSPKYLRTVEVVEICGVDEAFILRLEEEDLVRPVIRRKTKFYPQAQVDRIRVARLLIEEMDVNLEGAEVILHMREQMIAMQRQFEKLLRLLGKEPKRY